MHAYSVVPWESFFLGEVGATAALTGLLFVAVSINLRPILEYPWLPALAGETLLILAIVVVTATFGLVPGQSSRLLGAEVVAVAAGGWLFSMISRWKASKTEAQKAGPGPRGWTLAGVQLALIPFIIGGVSLVARWGGGLYWFVAGVVLSLGVALANVWILLVEIQR